MSQWGRSREFKSEDGRTITVLPHVRGPTWSPIAKHHIIDELYVTNGADPLMVGMLKKMFVGQPYRRWLQDEHPVK